MNQPKTQPNPKMYRGWIEYKDNRPRMFLGNHHTACAAEHKLSYSQYTHHKKDGGHWIIEFPDRYTKEEV